MWFKAQAYREWSDCEPNKIRNFVILNVPSDVNYDLYVYDSCGHLWQSATGGAGQAKQVTLEGDNDFYYYVEIRHVSGTSSCSTWNLQLKGYTSW